MSEWQPIETAPRDGSFFLAYQNSYYDIPFICLWADGNWRFHGEYPYIVSPELWLPLPEPPKGMNEQVELSFVDEVMDTPSLSFTRVLEFEQGDEPA